MSVLLDQLKEEAAKLTESERAELALALIQSLDADPEDDVEVERAWLIEADRRWGEIQRGEVQPVPGDEAFARLRRKFG
jgi:putative addiction module component (TIGR02574 family)